MAEHAEMAPRPGGGLEPRRPAPGVRSADQIRNDIQRQREELGPRSRPCAAGSTS